MSTIAQFAMDAAGNSALSTEFQTKLSEGNNAVMNWLSEKGYNLDLGAVKSLINKSFIPDEDTDAY